MRFKDLGTMVNAVMIAVDKIDPDPDQPRKNFDEAYIENLGVSLQLGQIHALLVRKTDTDRVIIISGENRWKAARLKGIEKLLCIQHVPDKSKTPERQHAEIGLLQLAANSTKPLTGKEIINKIRDIVDKDGVTVREVAEKTGYKESWIKARLSLSKAPVEVQEVVESGNLSRTAAAETARAPEAARKRIVDRARAGHRVKVREVQKEISGHARAVSATHVEKLIKVACGNCKLSAETPKIVDKWDFAVHVLQCVLGIEEMEDLSKPKSEPLNNY
jgi:ParB family chromosome partitioning protein